MDNEGRPDLREFLAREADEAEAVADREERELPDLSKLGAWVTPTQWEFFERVEFAPGMFMRTVDLGAMLMSKDVRPEELLIAFVLGGARPMEGSVEMREARCSGCGQPGALPADWPIDKGTLCTMCAAARRV